MKYAVFTIIIFILILILYVIYDGFKAYLIKKYHYKFYNDELIYTLIFVEVFGFLSIGMCSDGELYAIYIPLITICLIALFIVLISNIIYTSFLMGILTTIFQAIFALYVILFFLIISQQLKKIFYPNVDK